MPAEQHRELVERAVRWLKNTKGCSVVFDGMVAAGLEIPDAIGWKYGWSFLVECKASRSDFLADRNKPFRRLPRMGMGSHRYFMAPTGIIKPEELPDKWGLLEVKGRHVKIISEALGFPDRNRNAEIGYLSSMLRRVALRVNRPLNEFVRIETL